MSKEIFGRPFDYSDWLTSLNHRIQGVRQRAILAVNDAQIPLYHEIGREIWTAKASRLGCQGH